MTISTVAVTCRAFDQSGAPIAGAVYEVRLDRTDVDASGLIVPETIRATANDAGVLVLNLWPNVLGTNGSSYLVRATNPDTGKRFLDASVVVPNSACNLEGLLDLHALALASQDADGLQDFCQSLQAAGAQHKIGDTFERLLTVPADFEDGFFVGWTPSSQIRDSRGVLVAQCVCQWVNPTTTRHLRLSVIDTSAWRVGVLLIDVQFVRNSDNKVMSTSTAQFASVKDVTA